jgi:hypothetical protein
MSSSKKKSQNPIPFSQGGPLHTVYVYSHREWGGGRAEPERRLEGQQFTKLGLKYQHG